MPIIAKKELDGDCLLGVWEIEENYNELLSEIHLYPGEAEKLDSFKSLERKIEWLSVRILLKELLGHCGQIVYNDKRKPFLIQTNYKISISHSNKLTAIMLSKSRKVGIDLEYMSHRISKIRHKFINSDEYISDDPRLTKYHLYIHWCAKEALFKICDKQDINFAKNLTIEPFDPKRTGIITGWVDNIHWHDKFMLNYYKFGNYIIVYCCK